MSRPLLLSVACLASALTVLAQAPGDRYIARVSGHQQVPSVASRGEATVQVRISNDSVYVFAGDTMTLTTPIDEAVGAHIHTGYAGENGPVILALPYENIDDVTRGSRARLTDTVIVLPQDDVDALRASMNEGRNYINVHTLNYPDGEVRGQFFQGVGAGLTAGYDAMLYGDDENPAILTEGMGGVIAEFRADSMFFSGAFTLESPLNPVGQTGAHVHIGSFGQNGGILLALNPRFDEGTLEGEFRRSDNGFALDTLVRNAINARRAYVNIHSDAHPSGEIRGQLAPFGTNLYKSHVSQQAPQAFPNPEAYLRVLTEKVFGQDRILFSGSWSGWGDEITDEGLRIVATVNNPFEGGGFAIGPLTTPDADGGSGVVRLSGLPSQTPVQIEGLFLRTNTTVQWRRGGG